MKRQHSSDDEEKVSKQKLDLNSTPRGFDLNAPFAEEDIIESSDNDFFTHSLQPAAELGIDGDLDLLHSIWTAYFQRDHQRLDEILVSLCEEIGKSPSSPSKYHYLTCLYTSKKLPHAFTLPKTYQTLLAFLDSSAAGGSTKKQNLLPVISCKLLFRAYSEKSEWPLDFVKVYLEDAITSRNWVDSEHCKEFVANVITAFRDDFQDIAMDDIQGSSSDTAPKFDTGQSNQVSVRNRYIGEEIRQHAKIDFLQALSQLLQAPSSRENPRILFKVLMLGVCYEEVRVSASNMLEPWLNNPLNFRNAKLLLDRILYYTRGTAASDYETIGNILALRLSNQGIAQMKNPLNSLYTEVVFHIVQKRAEYSSLALKIFLSAELTNKGYQNMKGISTVLKALPDNLSPERELALVIKELALNEEFASRLQDVLSRLTKQLSSSFLLSRALLEPWPVIQEQPEPIKRSWYKQITVLACHLLIQSAVPFASDEKFLHALSSDDEQLSNESFKERFEDFNVKVMTFQVEALTWCTEVLNANVHSTDSSDFSAFVRQLMFLKPIEEYLSGSSTEVELNAFQLVAFSMHASEEILARVILMGISNQFPMLQEDALQIIETLVWRAVASKKHMFGTLFADSIQLPAAIMKLSSFNLPNVVRLPLPQVVLKDMYWRSCLVILAIAVYNPSSIGKSVWETLPAVKYLLEFLITGAMNLSNLNKSEDKDNDIKAEEAVEAFLEKEFGSNVEADLRSKWKGNIMLNDDYTNKIIPPKYVFEEVEEIDKIHSLGRTLRTCKKFNFLGDMLNTQNFKEAWTWMKRAVSKEPEIVGVLPSNWQCKLLYLHERTKSLSPLVQEFQLSLCKLIKDDKSPESEIISVITFFSQKLTSKNSDIRSSACRCFAGILSTSYDPLEENCTGWFNVIEGLKSSKTILNLLVPVLQEALRNESSVRVIWSYLVLMKKHLPLPSFAYTISRLLIERKLLSYGLLSVSSRDIINGSNDEGIFPIMDVYLDTFSEICSHGILEWGEEHLPLVDIVLLEDKSLSVASIVLEAMVEISSYVGSNGHYQRKETYARIVEFLFEKAVYFQQQDGPKRAVGNGQGGSILSKEQAVNLARTKDTRLIRAGLSQMNLTEKLKLSRELGLSSEAKGYIVEELEALPDSSANSILQPLSNSERLFLLGCFPKLSNKFPNILSGLDQAGASESPNLISDSKQPSSDDYEMEEKLSNEDIIKSTLEDVSRTREETVYSLQNYLSFRVLLQRSAMGENVIGERFLERIYEALNSVDASSLTRLASLLTPVLIPMANQKAVEHQPCNNFARKLLGTISAGVKQGLSGDLLVKRISEQENAMETEYTSKDKARILLHSFMHGKPDKLKVGVSYEQELLGIISILKEGIAFEDIDPQIELAGRLALLAGILSNFDPLAASEQWLFKSLNANPAENEKKMLCTTLLLQYAAQNIRGSSLASFTSRLCTQIADFDHVVAPVVLEFLSNQDLCASFMRLSKTSWPSILAKLAANVKGCPLKPLIYASSNDSRVMQALIKHLLLLAKSHETVQHIIHGLYVAFPVTVGSILDDIHQPELSLRASKLYYIVRDALNTVFSSRKNSAAYGLCYYVAKKHSAFIIQHIPTLRLHVEEIMTKINEASPEQLTSIANLFLFTLELLDATRPLVYSVNSEVYTLLLVYLQALEQVPSSNKSQFAKFAVKLAEFISAGLFSNAARIISSDAAGIFSERVQGAFQKFGQARKVTALLERVKDIPASQRDIPVSVDESAMEKIEQVKNILTNFLRLEACEDGDRPWDVVGINSYKERFESGGKLLSTLTDIDTASGHIPGILENMQDSLIDLLRMEDVDILDRTYILLARMLQYGSRSGNAGAVASAVLEQLDSDQGQRVEVVARHVGKLFHYFEELQEGILMKMFRSGKDVSESLVEIIADALEITSALAFGSFNMPETVELKVAMSCQGCVGAVKRVLGKLDGVDNFDINLEQQKVTVTTSTLKPEQVFEAVSKSGKATSYWPKESTPTANPTDAVA